MIVHRLCAASNSAEPGLVRVDAGRFLVGCDGGAVELLEVQMEGKKRMTAGEFLRGFQVNSGERVGI